MNLTYVVRSVKENMSRFLSKQKAQLLQKGSAFSVLLKFC